MSRRIEYKLHQLNICPEVRRSVETGLSPAG